MQWNTPFFSFSLQPLCTPEFTLEGWGTDVGCTPRLQGEERKWKSGIQVEICCAIGCESLDVSLSKYHSEMAVDFQSAISGKTPLLTGQQSPTAELLFILCVRRKCHKQLKQVFSHVCCATISSSKMRLILINMESTWMEAAHYGFS